MGFPTRFTNLDGSGAPSFTVAFRYLFLHKLLGRGRHAPDRASIPQVAPDRARIAEPPLTGARLTWIGHASWLVQMAGRSLLIDPVFGRLPGPGMTRNVEPGIALHRLPPIDRVLITHSHFDHLELPTLLRLGVPVIAGTGTTTIFANTTELAWWQSMALGDLRITCVPAQHWTRRGAFDANRVLWGGFVIEGPSARVYHAGDSAYFAGFRDIGRRFPAIDAALLPIGAYDPDWMMRPAHMNPEEAAQAFVDLGARQMFPMHWGTFKLSDEPLDEPPVRLAAEWQRRGLDESARRLLAIGETVDL